ncbi:hypothetical protein GQ44DRAFT_673718 [Phaeosphaeriaceae sp. PMI808]|nr:hypothetical protein GQ44DRAFT_673718 [Phaeosphaeriaceae sp. PMI808]
MSFVSLEFQPCHVRIYMPPLLPSVEKDNSLSLSENLTSMSSTADPVGWVSEPEGRGTIGLLWGCLATIFLCTWTAIHPDLPEINERKRSIIWWRIKHVLCCLLAPELFALHAVGSLINAMALRKKVSSRVNWSLKQCFFLQMGGCVVRIKSQPNNNNNDSLGGRLCRKKVLPWPEISVEQIDDHNKADWAVKAVALMQILWFVTQIVGRGVQRLAISTLELFTLGIVFCAVLIFICYWKKPYDIQQPVIIPAEHFTPKRNDCIKRVHMRDYDDIPRKTLAPIGCIITLVFGAIHLIAWNFPFPSIAERWLWRISSTGCAAIPIIMLAISYWSRHINRVLGLTYVLFRVYMPVEMFVSLRAAPASLYKTPQWSQCFPSFG